MQQPSSRRQTARPATIFARTCRRHGHNQGGCEYRSYVASFSCRIGLGLETVPTDQPGPGHYPGAGAWRSAGWTRQPSRSALPSRVCFRYQQFATLRNMTLGPRPSCWLHWSGCWRLVSVTTRAIPSAFIGPAPVPLPTWMTVPSAATDASQRPSQPGKCLGQLVRCLPT